MRFFLKIILWLAIAALLFLLATSFIIGYSETMSFLISLIHQEARADKILSLLNKEKFLFLQGILLISTSAIIFLLLKFNAAWEFVGRQFAGFRDSSYRVSGDALLSGAPLVLILPAISYIFFAFYMPVYYDEASTWLNYTSHSPLVSMLYYPAHNNHILHSVITNFTSYIPFLHPLQSMRISSVLSSILTCMLLYSFVKKYYSINSALVITGITSVLFMYIYYSFASRGYALVNLFFVLSLYSVYKIIFENNRLRYWTYFSIFSILGFYALPSFLYPFLTLNFVLLLSNTKGFLRQLVFGFATAAIVTMLYLPVIAVNGLEVLTHNKQVHSVTRMEALSLFPAFATNTLTEATGINIWLIAFLSLAALVVFIVRKQRLALSVAASFIIAPFMLMLLHSMIPFARTFSYYCIVLPFLCMIPLSTYVDKISRVYIIVAVVCIQSLLLYNFFTKMKSEKHDDLSYAEINKSIAGNHSYYLDCKLCDVTLSYELKTHHFDKAVIKYTKPLVEMSADTVSHYDYIIIDKTHDRTEALTPVYSDKVMNVYRK